MWDFGTGEFSTSTSRCAIPTKLSNSNACKYNNKRAYFRKKNVVLTDLKRYKKAKENLCNFICLWVYILSV